MLYLVIVLGVLSVSVSSILFRFATAAPLVVAFYRLAFSVALLSIPLVMQKPKWPAWRDVWLSVLSGVFLAAHFATWFFSLTMTSIASSTVLVNTHPFLVLLMGYLAGRERTTRTAFLGMCLSVFGAAMIGWGDFALHESVLTGDLLAFLGAVTVSMYLWIGRNVRQRVRALLYSTITYSAAAVSLLLVAVLTGDSLWQFDSRNWWVFTGLAVFPTIFGHTLFNWALKYVHASVISVNTLGEPIGATILAWLIWSTVPSPLTLVGGALILFGIWIFLRFQRNEEIIESSSAV